jgi:NADPH:quinone reductase-like Zn-dependent oxidoreductase
MPAAELEITADLVRRLQAGQQPDLAGLPAENVTEETMPAELNGRRVLVTGGASGIGAACAAAFAAAGAAVTVADLDEQGARKVAEPLDGGWTAR